MKMEPGETATFMGIPYVRLGSFNQKGLEIVVPNILVQFRRIETAIPDGWMARKHKKNHKKERKCFA